MKNIFDTSAMAIVNPVNTEGVMGKGLALEFKRRYPAAFREYEQACKRREMATGACLMSWLEGDGPRIVFQFPTKRAWRSPSKLEYIETGLVSLVQLVTENAIPSIAIPALGCGLGGLDWRRVKPMIEAAFSPLNGCVTVDLYEPT